jgi:pyridoxal/pyridoxine/pyridoxamine kinase
MRGKPNDSNTKTIKTLMLTKNQKFLVETPVLDLNPLTCCTGDLVTALFASHMASNTHIEKALDHTIHATYNILKYGVDNQTTELQLIAIQDEIEFKE